MSTINNHIVLKKYLFTNTFNRSLVARAAWSVQISVILHARRLSFETILYRHLLFEVDLGQFQRVSIYVLITGNLLCIWNALLITFLSMWWNLFNCCCLWCKVSTNFHNSWKISSALNYLNEPNFLQFVLKMQLRYKQRFRSVPEALNCVPSIALTLESMKRVRDVNIIY